MLQSIRTRHLVTVVYGEGLRYTHHYLKQLRDSILGASTTRSRMDARPAVIVLAAGKGSRFRDPEHKLVQVLHGQTVLATTLSQAIASELPVVVVTTPALADVARGSIAARDVIVVPEVGSTKATPLG